MQGRDGGVMIVCWQWSRLYPMCIQVCNFAYISELWNDGFAPDWSYDAPIGGLRMVWKRILLTPKDLGNLDQEQLKLSNCLQLELE